MDIAPAGGFPLHSQLYGLARIDFSEHTVNWMISNGVSVY